MFFVLLAAESRAQEIHQLNWISRQTLTGCLNYAKESGVKWDYLTYLVNGEANLMIGTRDAYARGTVALMCKPNSTYLVPDYN